LTEYIANALAQDMAVDEVNSYLYWTDSVYGHIGVASYNGGPVRTFMTNISCPKALAIDSVKR
jgi:hypothetical protein